MRRYRGGKLSLDVQHDLRTELMGSLSRLDGTRQDELHTGQIVSRSISDISMVQSLLSMVPMLMGNAVLFAGSLIAMAVLSPLLTVVALAVAPSLWFISLRVPATAVPGELGRPAAGGGRRGVVEAAVTGVRVVKGFGQESQEMEQLEEASAALYGSRVRTVRLMARYNPALQAVPALGQVGVLALGGWLALRGSITLGTFLAFSSYLLALVGPVRSLTALVTIGQEARASVIRVFEVIDARPVVTDRPGAIDAATGHPGRRARRREVRLRAVAAGAARPVAAGGAGRDAGPGRHRGLGEVHDLAAAPPVLRRERRRGPGRRLTTSGTSPRTRCGRRSGWCWRRASCSPTASPRTSRSGGPTRPGSRSWPRPARPRPTSSSPALPDGYDTVVGERGSPCPAASGSGSRWPAHCSPTRASWCSTTPPRRSTPGSRPRSTTPCAGSWQGRTTLLIAHRRSTLRLADRIAVLDEGRLVAEGSHEELEETCPLYRLLLAGPGDDAEGIDAGELGFYQNDAAGPAVDAGRPDLAGVAAAGPAAAAVAPARSTSGRLRSGASGGFLAGIPASPELLARVELRCRPRRSSPA